MHNIGETPLKDEMMAKRMDIFRYWQRLSIKNKFRIAFGTLIVFLALIAVSGTVALNGLQNRAERSNMLSTKIRHLVEGMNLNLYKARSLEKDFFLWYPIIGYSAAYQKYAQAATYHTKIAETLSVKLQDLTLQSGVSGAWRENKVNLNLFISSAKRHASTVKEAEKIIAALAADGTGLQGELARISFSLGEAFQVVDVNDAVLLFQQMQVFEKEYLATRQRPHIQSAFNIAVSLKEMITLIPTLEAEEKTELLASLNTYLGIAEEIANLDVAIRSKFKEFDLESEAITPITENLFALANQEIERARAQVGKRGRFSIIIVLVTALLGLFLSSIVAMILHKSITANVIKLTKATREFKKGNQEARADVDSADELGELGENFNAMASSIQAHVGNLEQKIAERTAQLETTNKQLRQEVTDRKQAEEEKSILGKRLLQAQKMEAIGTLAGGIAHDFNNILGAIIGYTELARDDSPEESSVVADLDKVLEASDRAAALVKHILAFSRQDQTEHIFLSPADIVEKTIAMLRPTLPTTIEIIQDIAPVTGFIFADPTQIHQILMNLCTNAFHAMEKTGGILDISLKETTLSADDLTHEPHLEAGVFIKLSVCDSGPGMVLEVKDKIFDPFFTTKEVGKGTGMGLSIVHGIVKNYGGFVTFYSQPGEGTAFHIFMPVINKEALPVKEAIQQIPVGVEMILFVDDEEILADMGKDILERLGYRVTVRKSSLEALETFSNQPDQFDLVITDQTMPGMTGADLARRMLQIRPNIPIILCTGYSSIISEEKARSIGISEFVLKPLTKRNIATLIRKVLDGNQKKDVR